MSAIVLNGVQVPTTDALRVRTFVEDPSLALAGSKRRKVVSEIVVHETVTRDVKTALRVLRKRKLGVHFIVAPDGELLQLADPIRTRLEHAAPHNVGSVGIEIVNPVEPRFLRPRLPWTRTLKARWAAGGHYVLPTPEQAEACAALIEFVTRTRVQGFAVPPIFRGEENGRLAMGRIRGATEQRPGIWAHSYFHHQDGAWPVLYAWLRLEAGLAPEASFEKAVELASGNVRAVDVGALRKVNEEGEGSMDLELTAVARALEAGGVYGLISVLVVGLVRLYRDLKAVNEQVVRLTEQQTAVMVRVEGALMALRDAILCMSGQPLRGPTTRMADRDDTHGTS